MLELEIFDNKLNSDVKIIVGQSAKENWKIYDDCEPDDIWFHLDDFSSPYVIIKNYNYNELSNTTYKKVACICKSNSKMKNINKVSVIYTPIGNLLKGKAVGSVIIKKNSLVTKLIV